MNPSVLCFRKVPVAKKFVDKKGGEYQDFASKIFCLTVPRNFVGQAFRVSPISVLEKFYASEGYVTIFCRNLLSHSAEKFRSGNLLCFVSESFLYRISLWIRRGSIKIFCRKIFVSQCRKTSQLNPLECH